MSKRKKSYLELFFILLIFLVVIFIFDLPKATTLTILAVIALFNILIFEMFIFPKW